MQSKAKNSHRPPFFLSLFCRTLQRNADSLNSTAPGDFISQTIGAHSDRNVSARVSPCLAQFAAQRHPTPCFPFSALAGQAAWPGSPPPSPHTPQEPIGPTCQKQGQAVGCHPRAVTCSQDPESREAEEQAGDRLDCPFCA